MADKVLVIEDTRSFSGILKKMIESSHGFDVDIVETHAAATEALANNAAQYFAAIIDLHLPDAPSGEAVELVVEKNIPAVVFTAMSDRSLEEDLWSRGISDYAHKSGAYSLEYVVWAIQRLYKNRDVHVLVVDDSMVARRTVAKLLQRQNYQVHPAANGDDALTIIEQHPEISIAIVDCFMEGMDGLQLTKFLREMKSTGELEIIGVSAQGGQALSAQFIKTGANDYLVKPFVPEELICRVNRCADRIESYINQKQLNEAKNRLLGTAAHDIRGPLAAIKTASSLIINQQSDNKRIQRASEMIYSNSTDLIELLESLLDVSAIESGKSALHISVANLTQILEERLELYGDEAQKKSIAFDIQQLDNVDVQCDPLKIKQVIDNLLSNAIKYSPSGHYIRVALTLENKLALLCVTDQGPGITVADQKNLFKPYATLSNKATAGEKQTGLGLAITKKIIEAHGGQIYYQSNQGGGSQFFVQLPLHQQG